jgi:ATP-binding cassette subfamily F protein uup
MLARLFTRPANVLVLDEPTNDLDIETLELLEAQLVEFPGTLLLVTHDRAFLDNVVTSTFVFEGNGRVGEYVGGYEDWLRQRAATAGPAKDLTAASKPVDRPRQPRDEKKLSYKEARELHELPARIESLEAEQRALNDTAAAPDFYRESADDIRALMARLQEIERELEAAYTRWHDLESRAGGS